MKQKYLIGALAVLVAVFCLSLFLVLHESSATPAEPLPETTAAPSPEPTPEPTPEPLEIYEYDEDSLRNLYRELQEDKEINPDVRALLCFQSGLIHAPVLQSSDVNEYLYKNWKTGEYLSYGSITMEPENDLTRDDQNSIIYGHYIYEFRNPDRTLVFTPLAELMKESAWEPNRYVSLITPDEVRYYEIAAVFECPLDSVDGYQFTRQGFEYNLLSYTPEYMVTYRENVRSHAYYDTGVEFDADDRFLTMQTCIEGNNNAREIVLCRELKRVPAFEHTEE